jgi:hypothetical protein
MVRTPLEGERRGHTHHAFVLILLDFHEEI